MKNLAFWLCTRIFWIPLSKLSTISKQNPCVARVYVKICIHTYRNTLEETYQRFARIHPAHLHSQQSPRRENFVCVCVCVCGNGKVPCDCSLSEPWLTRRETIRFFPGAILVGAQYIKRDTSFVESWCGVASLSSLLWVWERVGSYLCVCVWVRILFVYTSIMLTFRPLVSTVLQ